VPPADAAQPADAATSANAEVRERLARFVASRLPAGAEVAIGPVQRVAVGLSRENWVFDATWSEGGPAGEARSRPLIARRDPPGGLLDTDRRTEFEILRAVEGSSIPAPRALWLDPDGSELGRPTLVMERGTGSCDYFVLNGALPLERRQRMAERFCDLLADIHLTDWAALGVDATLVDPGRDAATVALDHWVGVLRQDQVEPLPELELVIDWLRSHAPPSTRTVLLHGDFKAGNMLLDDDDRVVLLLDWELAHLGDPHDDLGWITQPLRTREHLIAGHWEVADLLGRYSVRTGFDVDAEALRWWNAMACFKTAVMQVTGLASYLSGRTDTMYRLANGCVLAAFDLIGL